MTSWGRFFREIGSVLTERKEEEKMESCDDPSYRREREIVESHYREFRQKYDCTCSTRRGDEPRATTRPISLSFMFF